MYYKYSENPTRKMRVISNPRCGAHPWAMSRENVDFANPIFGPYFMFSAPNIRLLPTPLVRGGSSGAVAPLDFEKVNTAPLNF